MNLVAEALANVQHQARHIKEVAYAKGVQFMWGISIPSCQEPSLWLSHFMWGISLPSLACEVCHGGEATSSCSDVGDDGKPDERCREVDEEVWCHWKYADDGDWQRKGSGQSLSTRKVLRRCESAIVKREPGAWLEMGLMSRV